MAYVIDNYANVAHHGHNLRCLFDHAQRLRRKLGVPLFMTSDRIVLRRPQVEGSYPVCIYFCNGNIGHASFADKGIAGRFIKTWASKRGGSYFNQITGESNVAV